MTYAICVWLGGPPQRAALECRSSFCAVASVCSRFAGAWFVKRYNLVFCSAAESNGRTGTIESPPTDSSVEPALARGSFDLDQRSATVQLLNCRVASIQLALHLSASCAPITERSGDMRVALHFRPPVRPAAEPAVKHPVGMCAVDH
jgi:hypothetical protein